MQLPSALSPNGVLYMVTVTENDPQGACVLHVFRAQGLRQLSSEQAAVQMHKRVCGGLRRAAALTPLQASFETCRPMALLVSRWHLACP